MSKITKWENADIEIRAKFIPQRLWLGATIDVFLNQRMILSTGGKFKFSGVCVEKFEYDGSTHQVKLEWGRFWKNSVPCTLHIDDVEITQETINIEHSALNTIAFINFFIFTFICVNAVCFTGNVLISLLKGS